MTEQNSDRKLFDVAAEGYDRLMGRYLPTLGPAFADAAGVQAGQRALDVGCGPGGLTAVLADRLGPDAVAAIDPSAPFVDACRARHPGVDVRRGVAEELPFADDEFDAALACLVVGFMTDPVAGAGEMRRVTRPGGTVALCFWTLDRMPLLGTFWGAVRTIRPDEHGDDDAIRTTAGPDRRPAGAGRLHGRGRDPAAGDGQRTPTSRTGGPPSPAAPAPSATSRSSLTPDEREQVRAGCRELLGNPDGPFTLEAWTWCAVGTA